MKQGQLNSRLALQLKKSEKIRKKKTLLNLDATDTDPQENHFRGCTVGRAKPSKQDIPRWGKARAPSPSVSSRRASVAVLGAKKKGGGQRCEQIETMNFS